jgi:hypothetical protein
VNTKRNEAFLLLGVVLAALVSLTCGTPTTVSCPSTSTSPKEGCDEFKRLSAKVYYNSSEHTSWDWHLFNSGDTLGTDDFGQARVNVSDCWPGDIYIFKKSSYGFRVEDCTRSQYPTSGYCNPRGTWYVGDCADEFEIWTGSAKIKKTGSTYSVTYLPEDRQITLVVVLDGMVSVEPVTQFDADGPAPADAVAPGWFYFTMPDDYYSPVAGFQPRTQIFLSELTPVARELDIVDWMFDVRDRAEEDGRLPENWPPELGGQGEPPPEPPPNTGTFVVNVGGGALADLRIQEGILRAVNWFAVRDLAAPDAQVLSAYLGQELLNLLEDLPYDPDQSMALFEESAYGREQPVLIVYPVEDKLLAEATNLVAGFLQEMQIKAVPEGVPRAELSEVLRDMIDSGQPILSLKR